MHSAMFDPVLALASQFANAAAEPSPPGFFTFSSKVEAAIVALLMAVATYYTARAWKLRNLTAPQRRNDDEWRRNMENLIASQVSKLRDEIGAVDGKVVTTESLARTAISRVEDVAGDVKAVQAEVETVKDYMHQVSHGIRG